MWNRKQLLAKARAMGFKGATLEDLKTWCQVEGVEFAADANGTKAVNLDEAWAKTVYVMADAGEEVVVEQPEMEGEEMADPEKEEEPVAKRRTTTARDVMKGFAGAPAVWGSDSGVVQRKAYDAKAAQGKTMFSCADMAELAGAYFRYQGLRNEDYAQKSTDRAILKAAHVTFDNSLGGALVPDGFIAELILNKPNFGAAPRLTPITPMSLPKETRPRMTSGVAMTYTSENVDTDETNGQFDTVDLVSHEIAGYVPVSIRLLNNAAVSVADWLGGEFQRATGKKIDTTYFNGDSKQQGILTKIGSGTNSTVSVTGLSATQLLGVGLNDIQRLIAALPSWVDTTDAVFTMSRQVYELTLGRFEINAAGNTREDLRSGANPSGRFDRLWNGYGVIFNNITAKSYSNGSIPILFGDFQRSIMLGVLSGSQFMRSSEHDQFRKRNVVWQAGEEFAVNPHDVNDAAGEDGDETTSGVVGLKVAN